MTKLLLFATVLVGCYPADFVTSQGVAVFIEATEEEWQNKKMCESAYKIHFTHPNREMFENAFDLLLEEGPRVFNVSRHHIWLMLKRSTLYIKPERFNCGSYKDVAGCRWHGFRHAVIWEGDVWCSAVFHEFMHSLPIKSHLYPGHKNYGDRDEDTWWTMEDEINELYRVRYGNLREES